jgi:phytoene dehydrogenase-like protein
VICSSALPRICSEPIFCWIATLRRGHLVSTTLAPVQHGKERFAVVSSTNANWSDWANLNEQEYEASKNDLVETTLNALEKYVPGLRDMIEHAEAATPRTFQHYTKHQLGASFGTKFEGLAVSRGLAAANQRTVSRGKRWNHHVRLVGCD